MNNKKLQELCAAAFFHNFTIQATADFQGSSFWRERNIICIIMN